MKYFLVVISLMTGLISFSQENKGKWIFVCNGIEGDPYYIMSSIIKHPDSTISVWIKQTKSKYEIGKISYSNVTIEVLEDMNCKLNKEKENETIIYSSAGEEISKMDVKDEWHDVLHNSYGEAILMRSFELSD